MAKYCYLNGKIVPVKKASVSVYDLGLLRGFGVFDFLRVYNGKPFLLKEHLVRLANSARLLNLKVPLSRKEITDVIDKLLKKNHLKEATVRIVLTGGESNDGLHCDYNSPTFFILTKAAPNYPPSLYKNGIKLMTFEHQREVSQAKTTNYLTMISLQNIKEKKKAFEILYTSKGLVLEGASCNFFIFKGNTLITPKDNILMGTTRNFILKLAKGKFKIEARPLRLKELNKATEAFIASVTREILPVVKIDNLKIGQGKVGQNTKHLMDLFRKYVKIDY